MKELPAELLHFDQLKKISLDGNKFNVFSDRNLMNMPERIEQIKACDCPMEDFSTRIRNMKSLKRVVVDSYSYEQLVNLHWRNPEVEVILL